MSKMFSAIGVFGFLVASAAYAQVSYPLRADIPFAFNVRGEALPAGTYRVSYSPTPGLLTITGVDPNAGTALALARSEVDPKGASGEARLVFHCTGKNCSLAEVWQGSTGAGVQLPKASSERRVSFETRVISMKLVK